MYKNYVYYLCSLTLIENIPNIVSLITRIALKKSFVDLFCSSLVFFTMSVTVSFVVSRTFYFLSILCVVFTEQTVADMTGTFIH